MAFVERYVRADADGTGDGTTDANSGATGSWTAAQAISSYAAGQRVNVKAGSYSVTSGLALTTVGTTTSPVVFRGYKTTIGDMNSASHGTFMSGTETPAFDLGSNRLTSSAAYLTFENIDMRSSQTTNGTVSITGNKSSMLRCRLECTSTNANGRAANFLSTDGSLVGCWFKATTTATACIALNNGCHVGFSTLIGGVSGMNPATGANLGVLGCVFDSPASYGILSAGSARYSITNSVFYNVGVDGIRIAAAPLNTVITGCIFSVVGGIAINNSSGTNTANVVRNRNAYYSITTSQEAGLGDSTPIEPVSLTVDPFVDAASGDFNINNTAGGGADLRAVTVVLL